MLVDLFLALVGPNDKVITIAIYSYSKYRARKKHFLFSTYYRIIAPLFVLRLFTRVCVKQIILHQLISLVKVVKQHKCRRKLPPNSIHFLEIDRQKTRNHFQGTHSYYTHKTKMPKVLLWSSVHRAKPDSFSTWTCLNISGTNFTFPMFTQILGFRTNATREFFGNLRPCYSRCKTVD